MSVASFQYIRISTSSSNPSSPSSSSTLRFSATKPSVVSVRNSQADGQLRRPSLATQPLRPPVPPSAPTQTPSPTPPNPPSSASPPPPPPTAPPQPPMATMAAGENVITMEFQRQKAKELQEYFKQKKLDEADQGPFFGFIAKNEISNGRWAMFGFAVGMLTEYATGSDFVDQVKILLSNFGILDLE